MNESTVLTRSTLQAKRGTKQTCNNEECGSRYYDLTRVPSICPYCGASCKTLAAIRIDFDTLGKLRPRGPKRWIEPSKPMNKIAEADVDEVEVVEEQAEKETDLPSAAEDLLIEIEDDNEGEAPVEIERETT